MSVIILFLRESLESTACLCGEAEGYHKGTGTYAPRSLLRGGGTENRNQAVGNPCGARRAALTLFLRGFTLTPKRLVVPRCREVSSGSPAGCLLSDEEKQSLILNLQSTVREITFISLPRRGAGRCPTAPSPLSRQSFDESGRRTTTPSAMPSTVGFCLFSSLDDGMGYGCVEGVLDCWHQEGIENSQEILKVTGSSTSPLLFAFLSPPVWDVGSWIIFVSPLKFLVLVTRAFREISRNFLY